MSSKAYQAYQAYQTYQTYPACSADQAALAVSTAARSAVELPPIHTSRVVASWM